MTGRGASGRLLAGCREAASLGLWSLQAGQEELGVTRTEISARLQSVDEFWIGQRPLDVALDMGRTVWLWRIDHLTLNGARVRLIVTGAPTIRAR